MAIRCTVCNGSLRNASAICWLPDRIASFLQAGEFVTVKEHLPLNGPRCVKGKGCRVEKRKRKRKDGRGDVSSVFDPHPRGHTYATNHMRFMNYLSNRSSLSPPDICSLCRGMKERAFVLFENDYRALLWGRKAKLVHPLATSFAWHATRLSPGPHPPRAKRALHGPVTLTALFNAPMTVSASENRGLEQLPQPSAPCWRLLSSMSAWRRYEWSLCVFLGRQNGVHQFFSQRSGVCVPL